jgi:hypothetical protein
MAVQQLTHHGRGVGALHMLAAIACLLVSCAAPASVRQDIVPVAEPMVWPEDLLDAPAAQRFGNRVLAELDRQDQPPWTGDYLNHNGFEGNRLILSRGRYYYEYSNCEGTGALSYGQVESVEGQRIYLSPKVDVRPNPPAAREPNRRARFMFEPDLYVIRWNDEQIIVPASRMSDFCRLVHVFKRNGMRNADYPRLRSTVGHSTFRDSDFSGLPEVPVEFRHLLPSE